MKKLKPKEQHERLLADVDKEKIVQHLNAGEHRDIIKIAAVLARQCNLFVHFQRLWLLRVSDLDEKLGREGYMQNVYVNRRALLRRPTESIPSAALQTGPDLPATDTYI